MSKGLGSGRTIHGSGAVVACGRAGTIRVCYKVTHMLTRLRVCGFKNLVDVDVRFGPFTCIAGANGIGKSNLFDAIRFLSATASQPLSEAALAVRDHAEDRGRRPTRSADVRSLFHRIGDRYASTMSLEAEMIVPSVATDDFGQVATAKYTFLRYRLELTLRTDEQLAKSLGPLEIVEESLIHIKRKDIAEHLWFEHHKAWLNSILTGKMSSSGFISTERSGDNIVIKLHQDGGSRGMPVSRPAANLPRTVLSAANSAESPTVLCARRELESWRMLQLEPSALREPDEINESPHLGADGARLPATLYHLAQSGIGAEATYQQIANRLHELIDDVRGVWVDRDDKRELLTLYVTGRDGTHHPARSLSDGTLRFLALAVLELDPNTGGMLCFEEPENGIHPGRIPAILKLLADIATDPMEPVDATNPLRQVIINTHSPALVAEVLDESLLVGESRLDVKDGKRFYKVVFSHLPGTWRDKKGVLGLQTVARGKLMAYLNPVALHPEQESAPTEAPTKHPRASRVIDRVDLQVLLPHVG